MGVGDAVRFKQPAVLLVLMWMQIKLCPVIETGRALENELQKNRTHLRHRLHHRLSMYPHLANSASTHYGYGSLYDWSIRCIDR